MTKNIHKSIHNIVDDSWSFCVAWEESLDIVKEMYIGSSTKYAQLFHGCMKTVRGVLFRLWILFGMWREKGFCSMIYK